MVVLYPMPVGSASTSVSESVSAEEGEWLIDFLLAEGAGYAELRLQRDIDFGVVMKNGTPEPPEYRESYGAGIRVLVGGSMAFSATNIMTRDALREAGARAVKAARGAARIAKATALSREEVNQCSWNVGYKISPSEIDANTAVEVLREVDSAVGEIRTVSFPNRLLVFGGGLEEKEYMNSEGTHIKSVVPRVGGYFVLTAFDPGKGTIQRIVQMAETGGWERVEAMDPVATVRSEGEAMSRVLTEGVALAPGKYDVVVGGEVTGIISHEACGHPQEADRILGREGAQAGESYVKRDMIGRKIGSPALSISDSPLIDHSSGYYLYDDEGVRAKKKELIKEGVISGFLHNRETASEMGTASNAAARAAAFSREPIVRMSNTYTEPGDYSLGELLEGVDGVYIKSFQEWNIDDLRWNNRYVSLEAYLVEGGEIKVPVRAAVIEATTGVIFSSIDAVGKDLVFKAATCGKGQPDQGVPVWTGGPSMRLRGMTLRSR